MNNFLSHLEADEFFGKVIKFGFAIYAVALLSQVIQSYNLV